MPEDRPSAEIIENDEELDKWVEAYERRMMKEVSLRKIEREKAARNRAKGMKRAR